MHDPGMGRQLVRQLAAQGCSVAAGDWHKDTVADGAARAQAGAGPGVRVTGRPAMSPARRRPCGSATSL